MKCPKCGKEIANDSQFCEYCGAAITKQKNNITKIVVGVILGAFVIGGVLFLYGNMTQSNAKEEIEQLERQQLRKAKQLTGLVDLGLPSGTLWKNENEEGLYTYEQALAKFGSNLPSQQEWEELQEHCSWRWNGCGYKVTGPNGLYINLPAAGWYCDGGSLENVNEWGNYWSSTPALHQDACAWRLGFTIDDIYLGPVNRGHGFSIRLVQ